MNQEVKQFSGVMNTDDSNSVMPSTHHKFAKNLRFRGNGNNTRAEVVEGLTAISNLNLPNTGTNKCVGSQYDQVKQRVFYFNWNSLGKNGIYYYDIVSGSVVPLLISFVNSTDDIFGFDIDYPIVDIDIIYRTEGDGDILTWTQRNKRPQQLNIKSAIDNIYGSNWQAAYLDVAKAVPEIPIKCAYEDDNSVTVNFLHKKLCKFSYRFWYHDQETSLWSADSEIPIPFNYTLIPYDTDPTKNAKIACVVQTGAAEVQKIEIAVTFNIGNEWGDYSSVVILDKSELSISNNTTYIWRFFNNELYVPVDAKEKIAVFDYVPDRANSQALLNGNVICYGGITEGKNPVVGSGSGSSSSEYPVSNIAANCAYLVVQDGGDGFSGDIKFSVVGNFLAGTIFTAKVKVSATTYTISYTSVVGDTTASVITGLSTSASGQGFTIVSSNANELTISRTGQELLVYYITGSTSLFAAAATITASTRIVKLTGLAAYAAYFVRGTRFVIYNSIYNIVYNVVSSVASGSDLEITCVGVGTANETIATAQVYLMQAVDQSIPAYNSLTNEDYEIVYFDEKGKTNGVTPTKVKVSTPTFPASLQGVYGNLLFSTPYISLSITNRPPVWAKYYHIVRRSPNGKFLYWLTDRTAKDDKFAYISIDSISSSYKILNPKSVIGYDFSPGDRVRFFIHYNDSGVAQDLYSNVHDYEILEQVISPDINGVVMKGQWLKIALPATDSTFDFNTGAVGGFSYYYIELYTPVKTASEGLELSYQFSEMYQVGNWGTANCYHKGMLQDQSADLITPATFKFNKGDKWFRTREIPLGFTAQWDVTPAIGVFYYGGAAILGMSLTKTANLPQDIVPRTVPASVAFNPLTSWCLANAATQKTFNIKGQITISALYAQATPLIFEACVISSSGTSYYTIASKATTTANETFTLFVDYDITIPAQGTLYLGFLTLFSNVLTAQAGQFTITDKSKTFTVGVTDPNYSDFWESAVNSNGRAFSYNQFEKETYFPTTLRWGLAYQQNTNINQINRFYPLNFDEVDRGKGEIQRLRALDRILRVYQNRGVGRYGIYAKFVQSNGLILTTTDEILTKNNIQYYLGEYGMGGQYTALATSKNADYFNDPVRGYEIRLSEDGMIPINEFYKGAFYIRDLIVPYNKAFVQQDGSPSRILKSYNFLEEECVSILKEGTYGGQTIDNYAFSFNEARNAYTSFFDFADAEWIDSGQDNLFMWLNGNIYINNNTTNYANFFGVQYTPSITLVFNDKTLLTKTFMVLSYQASDYWVAEEIGDIKTSIFNSQTGFQQVSQLISRDFKKIEGQYKAAFLRDANSRKIKLDGLNNGDVLKGTWMEIKLSYKGSDYAWLYLPTVGSIDSPKNF